MLRVAAAARLCFTVSAAAFVPRPRVESAVLRLDVLPRPEVDGVAEEQLRAVVRLAFQQRRKTLRRALAAGFPAAQVEQALAAAALDGGRRGETLDLAEFARLAAALHEDAGPSPASGEQAP
jgi:16S rRNA (adenine1518-N6/adenine1519-N6)-dimethyltransferase